VGTKRKLAAILSADAAGYSKLMADDEAATLRSLNDARALFRKRIDHHGGRLIDTAGDSILAEFPSAVEAVECAVEIQHELARGNRQFAEHRRMQFRIGINLGDVIEQEDGTIYGDGVNVAARLQTLAEAGGICISGTAFDHVEGKLPLQFKFIGEQQVKNIDKPVRVFRVLMDATAMKPRPFRVGRRRTLAVGAAVVIAVMVAVGTVWKTQKPEGDQAAPSNDPALAMPSGPSIAVLPFANLSGDSKQDYFADGITEQIITELTRFRNLFVIARNSTFKYKGAAVDVRQVGRELGARYVVEGSVRRIGETVRVTAQLLDARSGAHLWAESYERDLSRAKVFGVQDEITERVVGAIGDTYGVISRTTFDESKAKGTTSLDAYECVLHAYEYYRVITPSEHLRVRDCLERATKLDPRYAEAWAELALIYTQEHHQAFNQRPNPLERALEAGERAVELDPTSQRGHLAVADAHFYRHNLEAFVAEAERTIALNPNNADALASVGMLLTYSYMTDPVKRERGVAMMRKAMVLSPVYPTWYHFPIAFNHYWRGEYEQALAESQKIAMPGYFWTHVLVAMIYGALGRRDDAQPAVTSLLKLYPEFPQKFRQEARKYNNPEHFIDNYIRHLRQAGLNIPPE
jgi:adenylate cyclase